jgi:hypothetical protein
MSLSDRIDHHERWCIEQEGTPEAIHAHLAMPLSPSSWSAAIALPDGFVIEAAAAGMAGARKPRV